ncbi:MAG: glutamate-cysteine ligase family protein [Bilifractor sp.]|jgi:glutamate--cysteine ligase
MSEETDLKNKDLLIDHFREGCKLHCTQKLGLEEEHFIVHEDTRESVTYYEDHGVEWILGQIADRFPHIEKMDGHLIGCSNNDYAISLEPAAQFEVSIAPRENIRAILDIYDSFRQMIEPLLAENHYRLVSCGYQPKSRADDLPLIPKKRYEFMDRYFQKVDTRGRNMMRGTASTQISVDYRSETDFVQKIRCAYLIMPAIRILTDNVPVFEGEINRNRLVRARIWEHVDEDRCGIVPHLFDADFGFEAYADYLWNVPLIFRQSAEGPLYTGRKSARDIWPVMGMAESDVEHLLSMVFPDVRLKNYVEIRGADSMPEKYIAAYLALIKGIFFHNSVIHSILDQFGTVREKDLRAADHSLMKEGWNGSVYGMPAGQFVNRLLLIARHGLDEEDAAYLAPFEELSERRMSLGEFLRENPE